MRFRDVLMIHSSPMYWNVNPMEHAAGVAGLVDFLISPQRPGVGALGIASAESAGEWQWLGDDEADAWLAQTYREQWLPLSDRFGTGELSPRPTANELNQHRCRVFFDQRRLLACLEAAGLETAGEPLVPHLYYALSVTWAVSTIDALIWNPQLTISTTPAMGTLAPARDDLADTPEDWDAEGAARVLWSLWQTAETDVSVLRHRFSLYGAIVAPGITVHPPVVFCATPTETPPRFDQYFEAPCMDDVETLTRVVLRSHDPLSSDISGAFLENNLVTLRRDRAVSGMLIPFYLVLPWWPASGKFAAWRNEILSELHTVSDALANADFYLGSAVHRVYRELDAPDQRALMWPSRFETAAEIARDLQCAIGFVPRGSTRKTNAFRIARPYRSSIARFEAEMLRVSDQIIQLERDWRGLHGGIVTGIRKILTSRPIPGVGSLLDAFEKADAYHVYVARIEDAYHRVQRAREDFRSVTTILHDMLDQEQREEKEREERNQRVLGVGLAILAAVAATPILLGQMEWEHMRPEMRQALTSLGASWLAGTLERQHPLMVLVSWAAAALIIVGVTGYVIWTLLQPDRWRIPALSRMGRRLMNIRWLAQQAERQMTRVLRAAATDAERQRIRSRVDAYDRRACAYLLSADKWIKTNRKYGQRRLGRGVRAALARAFAESRLAVLRGLAGRMQEEVDARDALSSLHERVEDFVLSVEILENRPATRSLPGVLALLYFRIGRAEDQSVVSKLEFESGMKAMGFDPDLVAAAAASAAQLDAAGFVEALRTAGLTLVAVASGSPLAEAAPAGFSPPAEEETPPAPAAKPSGTGTAAPERDTLELPAKEPSGDGATAPAPPPDGDTSGLLEQALPAEAAAARFAASGGETPRPPERPLPGDKAEASGSGPSPG